MNPKRTQVHVYPNLGGLAGWRVEINGGVPGNRGLRFRRRGAAIDAARIVYESFDLSELYVHNRRGRIVSRDTWPRSSDPAGSQG